MNLINFFVLDYFGTTLLTSKSTYVNTNLWEISLITKVGLEMVLLFETGNTKGLSDNKSWVVNTLNYLQITSLWSDIFDRWRCVDNTAIKDMVTTTFFFNFFKSYLMWYVNSKTSRFFSSDTDFEHTRVTYCPTHIIESKKGKHVEPPSSYQINNYF
jgi:hypothetical protein